MHRLRQRALAAQAFPRLSSNHSQIQTHAQPSPLVSAVLSSYFSTHFPVQRHTRSQTRMHLFSITCPTPR